MSSSRLPNGDRQTSFFIVIVLPDTALICFDADSSQKKKALSFVQSYPPQSLTQLRFRPGTRYSV
jgi:hypothetical protein